MRQNLMRDFSGLGMSRAREKKRGEEGVPGLFIAARFLAGGGRVARGRDDGRRRALPCSPRSFG
jgi:hypothetical protein